ncbi:MAG: hypothetical protein HC865_18565 [Cyanobacteria bacterium RU_5_0]|nr:hypothetical protein [Cyanobacteria bacterium RU_5_0]
MVARNIMFMLVSMGLATIVACVSSQPERSTSPASPIEFSDAATAENSDRSDRPDTKIISLSVEGETTEIELDLFENDAFPFTTYYPTQDLIPEVISSSEGMSVRFYFSPMGTKNEKAYIQFFVPTRSASIEQIQELILGDRGLLIRNQWELLDRTDIVSYPWANEKLMYQQPTGRESIVGAIYIGEENGQGFYVLTHYPAEYGDGFEPRSNIVLENVQFEE